MDDQDKKYTIPQLAVFDIDGTITQVRSKDISQEVLSGFDHLRGNGVITTVCTGRPYVRMKQLLGDNFDRLIDDRAYILVEHGAKIVNKSGEVIVESEFSRTDIDKLIEFTGLNLDMVRFLAYNPADIQNHRTQIWCPEPLDADQIREERGDYADITTGPLIDIKEKLYNEPISNITLKLKKQIHVENLKIEFTGGSIKAVFQDGALEYMKSDVSKARAITYMTKRLGIFEHHLLVAGNASNDVDMINMGAGHRVLVGPEGPQRDTIVGYLYDQHLVKFVDTPEDLGRYLQSL